MRSRWDEAEAGGAVERYAEQGVAENLALRVYSTRLLGGDPKLVLHGGGNTSVKLHTADLSGEQIEVLHVKGSGWDMAAIEPTGLPAVRLEPLRRLRTLAALSDEEMVNQQRRNLLDSTAPNPSVETLLHAFLPQRFVDHTHANAVLAVTDQPDGERICEELYGERAAVVRYIMPGFELARLASNSFEGFEHSGGCEGLILLKHGVFTFGDSAREAYERMIDLVTLAEERLARGERRHFGAAPLPPRLASPAQVAPVLRGLLASERDPDEALYTRFVLTFRSSEAIREYVGGEDVARYARAGTATPDHVIRIKPQPVIVPAPAAEDLDGFARDAARAIADYRASYEQYFARNNARVGGDRVALDSAPRVLLVPGLGIFAAGEGAAAAGVAADLAEATVEVVRDAESIGTFESTSEQELFDIEYWSLEQAKLGKVETKTLAGHVVVVTGGAGTIGAATGAAFRAEGAEVALLDRDVEALQGSSQRIGALPVACDVTDRAAVLDAFDRVAEAYGGVDIVVSNAGAAWQGPIGEVSDEVLRASFELNFFAHQHVAQAAVAMMRRQATGGVLLFNASKQAVNPGANFGPYGLPKAATFALARQYALEYGGDGIRSNVVNADRIRGGLLTDELVSERAAARGVSEDDYLRGNLLGREVRADDVARAFVQLALARKTTGAALTVDGGNIAAALR